MRNLSDFLKLHLFPVFSDINMEGTCEKIQLRAMGFCGADDSVSQEFMIFLSEHYPFIEWGVLFRPDLEGTPRYASWGWTTRLCQLEAQRTEECARKAVAFHPMRLAAHLCGSRCQEILDGDSVFVGELQLSGFKRVQVNATRANNVCIDSENIEATISNVRMCMAQVPSIEWILQYNEETRCICDSFLSDPMSNMSILYDASCGLGIEMKEFPVPERTDIKYGYAGGINPNNICEILTRVQEVTNGKAVWVDMESSLRVKIMGDNGDLKDVFSIEKCFSCITAGVQSFGLATV